MKFKVGDRVESNDTGFQYTVTKVTERLDGLIAFRSIDIMNSDGIKLANQSPVIFCLVDRADSIPMPNCKLFRNSNV